MKLYTSLTDIPEGLENLSLAIGMFDGIHLGHRAVIRTAVEHATDKNLVAAVFAFRINETSFPEGKSANQKIQTPSLFVEQLKNMGVSILIIPSFEEVRNYLPEEFIREIVVGKLGAKFLACGQDFHFGKNAAGDVGLIQKVGEPLGLTVQAVPLVTQEGTVVSSTEIRAALSSGDIAKANKMLGTPYSIDFQVVHGKRIGRTLGTPTINQPYPEEYVVPRAGVYASITYVDERLYTSVTNVGTNPTVGGVDTVLAETYIQNYDGDLYGQHVRVMFLEFLRKEEKFPTIEAMREQIYLDSAAARKIGQEYIKN